MHNPKLPNMRSVLLLTVELLRVWFREWPLSKAPMTPVLSEWTTTSTLRNPRLIRDKTASSRAMDSAQLMSWSAAHHPSASSHANQPLGIQLLMPKEVKALICMSGSTHGRGVREREVDGLVSESFHQRRSDLTSDGMWWWTNTLGNFARKVDRAQVMWHGQLCKQMRYVEDCHGVMNSPSG